MTDVQPNDPERNDETGLEGDDIEAGRAARKAAANQDPQEDNNPADRTSTPRSARAGIAAPAGVRP